MTNLEFIDELIIKTEQNIKHWERQLENYPNEEVFTLCLNKRKEDLQNLYQIKNDLEAWELLKTHEIEIDRLDSIVEYWVVHIWKPFNPEQINKIKKALEINKND